MRSPGEMLLGNPAEAWQYCHEIPYKAWKARLKNVPIAPRFGKARARHLSGSLATLRIMTAFATTTLADTARLYAEAAAQAVAETLWPTRCAICDEPGELLCERCKSELPFIDLWRACPICGAPWGHTQCTECNPVMLAATGREAVAFSSLASPFELTESSRRIVVVYKDGGEQRLAAEMAHYMARYLSPEIASEVAGVTFVPASRKARARRGFDHAELLAQEVAAAIGRPVIPLLSPPRAHDQRALSRRARMGNMAHAVSALPGASAPESILLIDDVCTTGATLFAACDAIREAGGHNVHCLTFARA